MDHHSGIRHIDSEADCYNDNDTYSVPIDTLVPRNDSLTKKLYTNVKEYILLFLLFIIFSNSYVYGALFGLSHLLVTAGGLPSFLATFITALVVVIMYAILRKFI